MRKREPPTRFAVGEEEPDRIPSGPSSPPSFTEAYGCGCSIDRQRGKAPPKLNAAILVGALAMVFALAGVASLTQREESASVRPTIVRLPRLVEVGGEKCIPCLKMAPILKELAREYEGRVEIEKIDLGKTPSAQYVYAIQAIPTQIFLTPDAQEFWRHEGTLTKEEIVAKFAEMGIR